jgi:hypothetical protein
MTGAAWLFVLVVLLGIGGSLLLYPFVREERNWDAMDRETAERTARRDGGDENR